MNSPWRSGTLFLIPAFLGTMLLGCSEEGTAEPSVPTDVGLLLIAQPSDEVAYPSAEVPGQLTVEDDCLALDGLPVLWPNGTTWDQDSQEVVMPDGTRVSVGSPILGSGGVVPTSVAVNYGDADLQEGIDECAAQLGVADMALLSDAESQ